jgi:hypothetical protein
MCESLPPRAGGGLNTYLCRFHFELKEYLDGKATSKGTQYALGLGLGLDLGGWLTNLMMWHRFAFADLRAFGVYSSPTPVSFVMLFLFLSLSLSLSLFWLLYHYHTRHE